jgi:predicted HAD superfamily Cof-like phosphohydrolase
MMKEEHMSKTAMIHWLGDVARFCRDIVELAAPDRPTTLSPDRAKWFAAVVSEELGEFLDATARKSVPDAADAVVDLIYFALGRLYEMGVPAQVAFDDVQRANMRKVRGMKKERSFMHECDAVKPDGWTPPDHSWLAHLSPVAIEAARIRAKKRADYRGDDSVSLRDYFPFAELSYAQMIWTKALRIRNLAKQIYDARVLGQEHRPQNESFRDSLVDLHNYVDFAAEDIDGAEVD